MLEDASWQKAVTGLATTYVVEDCKKNAPGIPVIPSLNHRALRLIEHAYSAQQAARGTCSLKHTAPLRDARD